MYVVWMKIYKVIKCLSQILYLFFKNRLKKTLNIFFLITLFDEGNSRFTNYAKNKINK